jgi:hypothetical protein
VWTSTTKRKSIYNKAARRRQFNLKSYCPLSYLIHIFTTWFGFEIIKYANNLYVTLLGSVNSITCTSRKDCHVMKRSATAVEVSISRETMGCPSFRCASVVLASRRRPLGVHCQFRLHVSEPALTRRSCRYATWTEPTRPRTTGKVQDRVPLYSNCVTYPPLLAEWQKQIVDTALFAYDLSCTHRTWKMKLTKLIKYGTLVHVQKDTGSYLGLITGYIVRSCSSGFPESLHNILGCCLKVIQDFTSTNFQNLYLHYS